MIGPGDKVVCVNVAPIARPDPLCSAALRQLRLGRKYTVLGIADSDEGPGLLLAEVVAAHEPEYGWHPDRFRKLDNLDPCEAEFKSLIKRPLRQKVKA